MNVLKIAQDYVGHTLDATDPNKRSLFHYNCIKRIVYDFDLTANFHFILTHDSYFWMDRLNDINILRKQKLKGAAKDLI